MIYLHLFVHVLCSIKWLSSVLILIIHPRVQLSLPRLDRPHQLRSASSTDRSTFHTNEPSSNKLSCSARNLLLSLAHDLHPPPASSCSEAQLCRRVAHQLCRFHQSSWCATPLWRPLSHDFHSLCEPSCFETPLLPCVSHELFAFHESLCSAAPH